MDPFAALPSASSGYRSVQGTSAPSVVQQARVMFGSRVQGNAESAVEYAEALRTLAMQCGYEPQYLEGLIRDQFIFGLAGKAIQDHLREQDESVTLTKIISIAVDAEDVPFGDQHPRFKEEIQLLIGPHLDHHSLLMMRSVSKDCKRLVDVELCRRQKQALQEYQWSPCSRGEMIQGNFTLYFSSPERLAKFMQEFGRGTVNSFQGWPFFGEGIVDFDVGVTGVVDIVKFLKTFGAQVTMAVWRNVSEGTTLNNIKTMLSHTPNLTTLWIGWTGNLKKLNKMPGTNINSWPELPYLDSLHCWCDWTSAWMAHRLLLSYGSKLTALKLNESLDMSMLILLFPSNPVLLRPLSKIESLPIEYHLSNMNQFGENTDWKLEKLSFAVDTCSNLYQDFLKFRSLNLLVQGSDLVWGLINQSRKTLEQVYLNLCRAEWKDFIQLYLLPVFHNPAYKSLTCLKVRKVSIPFLFLMKARRVFEMICTKFPNVEHVQFTSWEVYPSNFYNNFMNVSWLSDVELDTLLGSARNLFFEEADYNFPIFWNTLSHQILVQLWNNLGSLQKITVLAGVKEGPEEIEVVFKQTRKSKDQEIITTTTYNII